MHTLDHDWRLRAACAAPEVNPDWFFAADTYAETRANYQKAKQVCATCPVQAECLLDAKTPVNMRILGFPDTPDYIPDGILGGLTKDDRKRKVLRGPETPEQRERRNAKRRKVSA